MLRQADDLRPRAVPADSEVRQLLKDKTRSSFAKYAWLTVGSDSWLAVLQYELFNAMFAGVRGALGILLRRWMYRRLLRKCGRRVVIGRNVTLRHPHRIEIGDDVVIDDNVVLDAKGDHIDITLRIESQSIIGRNSMLICKGGSIHVSRGVNISVNCTLISESQLRIGEDTLIAGHCYMNAGGNHGTNCSGLPFVQQDRIDRGGINIQRNCWICAHATILDGTTVGPDVVVAAGAVVHRTLPPKCVIGGVPARVLSSAEKQTKPQNELKTLT